MSGVGNTAKQISFFELAERNTQSAAAPDEAVADDCTSELSEVECGGHDSQVGCHVGNVEGGNQDGVVAEAVTCPEVAFPEARLGTLERGKYRQLPEDSPSLSPMLRQYIRLKSQYREQILLFQVGDFYELFFDDAILVSKAINIRLTSRDRDAENPTPMCGIPIHALDNYLPRLLREGFSCVIYSQVESAGDVAKGDAKKNGAKGNGDVGIVRREITRIVTPGVRFEGDGLEEKRHNYLAAFSFSARGFASLCCVDVSTGHLKLVRANSEEELRDLLDLLQPSELIYPSGLDGVSVASDNTWIKVVRRYVKLTNCHSVIRSYHKPAQQEFAGVFQAFFKEQQHTHLQGRSSENSLSGNHSSGNHSSGHSSGYSSAHLSSASQIERQLGWEESACLISLFRYVEELSVGKLPQFAQFSIEESSSSTVIDAATRKNLEILLTSSDASNNYSLINQLDRTETAMGGRLLSSWLLFPSCNYDEIVARHDAVTELSERFDVLKQLRGFLGGVRDLDRLTSRITSMRASPRDLLALGQSLAVIPHVKALLSTSSCQLLSGVDSAIADHSALSAEIVAAIVEEPPTKLLDGGIFREGYNQALDGLRSVAQDAKAWLLNFEAVEREATGIPSLKVRYNNAFGYFIEISKTHLSKVPSHYERRQTLVNAERFVTKELKDHELQVLSSRARQVELEKELFYELRAKAGEHATQIQQTSHSLAVLDVIASYAFVAREFNYCRPLMLAENSDAAGVDCLLCIKGGRHPVVERVVGEHKFVPNDTAMDGSKRRFAVLTGPNMGGKSTYLRQIGLIQLLAQAGSFVPAERAELSIVDRIFTRIGASDNLIQGDSTFMVEMREASTIVRKATSKSLVLIDEIGRGTATTDGLAIATAIAEWLLNFTCCKTIFATHFHELTSIGVEREGAFCLSVGVIENDADIIFTHRIEERIGDRSYGLEVAKLAGLPEPLIARARAILNALDDGKSEVECVGSSVDEKQRGGQGDCLGVGARVEQGFERGLEMRLIEKRYQELERLADELTRIDTERLTPLEAIVELTRLQKSIV